MDLFEEILKARGITPDQRALFLSPKYESRHDPFLLPDMEAAVERLNESAARIYTHGVGVDPRPPEEQDARREHQARKSRQSAE